MTLSYSKLKISVYRDGVLIGFIREAKGGAGGYYFKSLSGRMGGIYSTIDAVKRTIEG